MKAILAGFSVKYDAKMDRRFAEIKLVAPIDFTQVPLMASVGGAVECELTPLQQPLFEVHLDGESAQAVDTETGEAVALGREFEG